MESKKRFRLIPFLCTIVAFALYCERCYAGDCPADGRTWVPFGQSCYHFVHGEENRPQAYTLDTAKATCRGYELLSVRNAEENQFIIEYSPQVWKGNINVWLGLYFNTDNDTFMWHDNTGVEYVNWEGSGVDSGLSPVDVCAALHSSTGKWEQVSCLEDVENGVVCEAAQESINEKAGNSPMLTALVALSVLVILGVSAVLWFFHQRQNFSSSMFTAFEYHPPFRSPTSDVAALVDSEETDEMA
ncbi:hypothetical protein AAFF_G00045400 [Aldrovandia affinis]|uniref:C-type lectin domain-containing protein n=1 Tax=Aldrovandia affinis TaxID=143900 RepID=A0AAD7WFC6_9TELE|nr:hypothetical protein AAFF_G00045400 [Aldrovandia affinis]